jgi:hypothetical protein
VREQFLRRRTRVSFWLTGGFEIAGFCELRVQNLAISWRPLDFVPREPPFGAGSDPSNIVDACYPYGSVQVPGGTEPIMLHRDAVSGGGYFMIGTIISADMDLVGQLEPNATARFTPVTMEQALAARFDREKLLNEIRESL